MKPFLHPRFSQLSAFVDNEVNVRRAAAIKKHLIRCPKCRATVEFIEELQRGAASLRVSACPESLRGQLASTMEQSDDVQGGIVPEPVLPTPERVDHQLPTRSVVIGGAAVALLVGLIAVGVPSAVSDTTVLEFHNEHPAAGDVVEVTYRSNGRFSFGDGVVLRAEVLRKGRPSWDSRGEYTILDTLERSSSGRYEGGFSWPVEAAVMDFAVESLDALQVDTRVWGKWILLEHAGDHPSFAALQQRYYAAFRAKDHRTSLEAALRAADFYPDEPEPWDMAQVSLTKLYGGHHIRDSLDSALDDAFARLVAKRFDPEWSTPERISQLYGWAAFRRHSLQTELRSEMIKQAPGTHYAVLHRALDIKHDFDETGDPLALQRLEALWHLTGPKHLSVVRRAFDVAMTLEDRYAALEWGNRLIDLSEDEREAVFTALLELDEARDAAITELRTTLQELQTSHLNRKLYQTASQFATAQAARQRRFANLLGRALVDDGRITEGLGYLEFGMEAGWDVKAFRAAAEAYLARGDTLSAARFLARIAVSEDVARVVSRAGTLGEALTGASWKQLYDEAHASMMNHLAGEVIEGLSYPDTVQVLDGSGRVHSLRSVLTGMPHVVAFVWFDLEGEAVIDSLAKSAPRRLEDGVRTFIVTDQYPTEEFRQRSAEYPDLTWLHDVDGDARRYFGTWRVPDYFVVSADGSSQFRYSSEEAIPRQLAYLRSSTSQGAQFTAPE